MRLSRFFLFVVFLMFIGVPQRANAQSPLNVTTDQTLTTGTYTYTNVTISNNATLFIDGTVKIEADNVTIQAGSRIDASASGYPGKQGPGAGTTVESGGSGGGYGGKGGENPITTNGGDYYGSAVMPHELGSGGGGVSCTINNQTVQSGGAGGGALWIDVTDTLTVSGTLAANGGDAYNTCDTRAGGGSGGALLIGTDTLTGSGVIQANGGDGGSQRGGGGAGGRIAIYYGSSNFNGIVTAIGGEGVVESGVSSDGDDGTVGFFDTTNNNFAAGQNWRFQVDDGPFVFDTITLDDGSLSTSEGTLDISGTNLLVDGASTLYLTGEEHLSFMDVDVQGNSSIIGNTMLKADNLTIASGSKLSADSKGYSGGRGVGAGLPNVGQGGGGGGYGGEGGTSLGGIAYGSATAPVDFGSGGAGPGYTIFGEYFPSSGGFGGGRIQLRIADTLTVNGTLSADGGKGLPQGSQSGGGAGGSIYVITENFTGSGAITANGGDSQPVGGSAAGGGGGGGRIAIFHRQSETYTGALTATGGNGVGEDGEDGTAILVSDQLAVSPSTVGNTHASTLLLSGTTFSSTDTVKLTKSGESDIIGQFLTLNDTATTMGAVFNFKNQSEGAWDLVLTKNGQTTTLSNAVTVEQGKAPDINIEFVGLNEIRPNRAQRINVVYHNRGNTNSPGGILLIQAPLGVSITPDFDSSFISPYDTPEKVAPSIVQTDTAQVLPVALDSTPPGHAEVFSFVIETPFSTELELKSTYIGGDLEFSLALILKDEPRRELDALDEVALGEAVDIVADKASDLGLQMYNPFGGLCVETHYEIQKALLEEPCNAQSTNLEGWNVKSVEIPGLHNATLLTSPNTQRQYIFDPWINLGTMFPIDVVEVESGTINNVEFWEPLDGQFFKFAAVGAQIVSNDAPYIEYQSLPGDMWPSIDADIDCSPPTEVPEENTEGSTVNQCRIPMDKDLFRIDVRFSIDPNEKVGTSGVGSAGYITKDSPLTYTVLFENLETATVPAQEVLVTDTLDTAELDLDTFSLGPITFGETIVTPPSGLKEYITEVDLRPDNDIIVRVEAGLDESTDVVTWRFSSLDPETHMLTSDPSAGFLPPNVNAPEGDGSVSFTIRPKSTLSTEDEISNSASIIFDTNSPINTSTWLNTIDETKPQSSMNVLSSPQTTTSFDISWSGTDSHSGIREYSLFVREDAGEYTEELTTTGTMTSFVGVNGSTYDFYTVATDNVGNVEDAPSQPDLTITISDPMQEPCTMYDNYLVGVSCFSSETVTNDEELDDYLLDFGYNGSKYKDLIIDYDVEREDLDIHSPCEIKVKTTHSLTGQRICVDGREGVSSESYLTINGTFVTLISKLGDVDIGSNATLVAKDMTLQAYEAAEISVTGSITIEDTLLLKSTGNSISSKAKMGQNSIISAGSLRLEAIREVSTGPDMSLGVTGALELISTGSESTSKAVIGISSNISAGSLEMSADRNVEIGASTDVSISGAASMESTGTHLTSDVEIGNDASISADSLDMTGGDEAKLQPYVDVTTTNNFNMQADTPGDCFIDTTASISAGSESGNCL